MMKAFYLCAGGSEHTGPWLALLDLWENAYFGMTFKLTKTLFGTIYFGY